MEGIQIQDAAGPPEERIVHMRRFYEEVNRLADKVQLVRRGPDHWARL